MRAAAALFAGRHDFQSFTSNPGYSRDSTVRTVTRCDLKRSGRLLTIVIEGEGFLYKMCRGIAGTIVQVGLGKFPANAISEMLASKDRRVAGMTAPAKGLILWRVLYSKPGRAEKNPKSEIRNPKQIRNSKSEMLQTHSKRETAPG
jgi:tRNA pseudouridine38-40 synthase